MNLWIERSIQLANSSDYLDRLSQMYPVVVERKRQLPAGIRQGIIDAYEKQDELALVKALMKLPRFPVKDPYVAFLKKRTEFVNLNPATVSRLGQRLLSMGFAEMMARCEEPKEFNTQIGPLFCRRPPI